MSKAIKMTAILSGGAAILGGFSLLLVPPTVAADTIVSSPAAVDLSAACSAPALTKIASGLAVKTSIGKIGNPTGPVFPEGFKLVNAKGKLPAFCQVTGKFVTNPATGKTANFLATFPANWNGKYLQLGCSGHCGQFAVSDPASPALSPTYPGEVTDILSKGYAAFATDEGHEGFTAGTWAIKGPGQVDEEAIEDFLHRATKTLTKVGKSFTIAFYERAKSGPQKIARSYFNGCSGGGRDAFVAASYFPEEFDGIIAGSAYNGMGTSLQMIGLSVAQLRSKDAAITPELAKLIDPIVKKQCDAMDGVQDGLIQNPSACNFVAERDLPKCDTGNASQCFTPAQIETVSAALSAVRDDKGRLVQPGFTVSEMTPGLFSTPKRPADLDAPDPFPKSDGALGAEGYWPLGDAFVRVMAHKNDPAFFSRSIVSFAKDPKHGFHIRVPASEVAFIRSRMQSGIGHFPEKLAPLIKQDRKFLIWHNLSDQILTSNMSINYYAQLAKRHGGYGKLQKNVRLFSLPGTPHCNLGGIGPNTFDALSAMENWVEKGIAPNAIPASLVPIAPPYGMKDFSKPRGRSMPLCAFPAMARYSGTGDVNDGKNWTCPKGDKRMLKVGESGRRAGAFE